MEMREEILTEVGEASRLDQEKVMNGLGWISRSSSTFENYITNMAQGRRTAESRRNESKVKIQEATQRSGQEYVVANNRHMQVAKSAEDTTGVL